MPTVAGADKADKEGYFPRWKLKTSGVIMPDERLPWGQTLVSGLQPAIATPCCAVLHRNFRYNPTYLGC